MIPPNVPLNDGRAIPQLGFGVWQIEPEATAAAVAHALETGYRHIDTAQRYGNEQPVGDAIRASGLDRADVFITSKLDNGFHRPAEARRAFESTLLELGVDYVDLFLIHWPLPTLYDGDFVSTWKVLEDCRRDERARSIGVSNFQVAHLERLPGGGGGGAPLHPGGRGRRDAPRQPGRAAPVLPQRRGPPLRTGRRHRHRGVVPARPGQRPRRPGRDRDRRADRPDAGSGRPALAPPARPHRVPEVDDPRSHRGELRRLRLRARARRRRADRRPRRGRGRAHRAQPRRVRLPPGLRAMLLLTNAPMADG